MRILWVNNIAIPKIAEHMGAQNTPFCGWLVKLADDLSAIEENELHIMFPYHLDVHGKVDKINYTGFTLKNEKDTEFIKETISSFKPDVINIFGTEYAHSYVVTRICQELGLIDKVVISIQGLVSAIADHYTAHLPHRVIVGSSIRDIMKGNVQWWQKHFRKLGKTEIKTLKMVKHVIGRTDWDKAVTGLINPEVEYHFNNEMLRDSFYKNQWDIDKCERYSIFCGQATAPYKGVHLAIEAVAMLKKSFTEVHLYIAGKSYTEKPKYKLSYYERYVLKRIEKLGLHDYVTFTGFLNEQQMCERTRRSHVAILPSSVENSPNAVCEAQILGMPVVSSLVGGVANLIEHGVNGYYYQADAPYMLAYYIKKVFEDDERAIKLGKNARSCAMKRHEPSGILEDLNEIYHTIAR